MYTCAAASDGAISRALAKDLRHGRVETPPAAEQRAEVAVRVGEQGVEPDRLAIGRFGLVEPRLVPERIGLVERPAGLRLAHVIGEEADTIEDVLEPYLIQGGYLQRTPRGRMATLAAYRHFGITAPAGARDLLSSVDPNRA